jgi:hypothetical protein
VLETPVDQPASTKFIFLMEFTGMLSSFIRTDGQWSDLDKSLAKVNPQLV